MLPKNKSSITERHIQALWLEQKYFANLCTTDGLPLSIISAGIWNLGAGPDFQKAHICIAGKHYFGDIELHLHAEAWYHHRHHLDAQYDQVILHIALWQSNTAILTASGLNVAKVHLEPHLTLPIGKLALYIDLDLYPYKEFLGSGKCAHQLFNGLSKKDTAQFFERAASWRLQQKYLFLKSAVPHPQLYLAGGIAMALGYKNNAQAFLNLFLELKAKSALGYEERLAWLLGRGGFFQDKYALKWQQNAYYAHLAALYSRWQQPAMVLSLTQIRPLNHPIRRLVWMAKWSSAAEVLQEQVLALWGERWQVHVATSKWTSFLKDLEGLIPHYTDAYWNSHYLFEEHAQATSIPLMGKALKREMLLNALFPLLAESADPAEKNAFYQLYRSLGTAKTGKATYLNHRYFGSTRLDKAYQVQGAYQLHADYCFHFEASCAGCPFVEQYQADHFANEYRPSFYMPMGSA